VRFGTPGFERLAQRMAAAPRSFVAALVLLAAVLSPGVIRVELSPVASSAAPVTSSAAPGASPAASGAGETVLFELSCDAGVWTHDCLDAVESLSHVLETQTALVRRVDSLTRRPRVVLEHGALALRPFVAEPPEDAIGLRRLRARASDERGLVRALTSANERAALVHAELVPGASARDVQALVESLRARFDRPPARQLDVVSTSQAARELELSARADLARVTPAALLALLAVAAAAFASARAAFWVGALAVLALACAAGVLGLGGVALGPGAVVLPVLVCAAAAATACVLLHRIRIEQRGGADPVLAVERAVATLGAPLCAAAVSGVLASLSAAAFGPAAARPLALAGASGIGFAALCVGLGLPASLLARAVPRRTLLPNGPLAAPLESALGRLDVALRSRRLPARRMVAALALLVVAGLGLRALRSDLGPWHLSSSRAGVRQGMDQLAHDFGGAVPWRVAIDSGVDGGAADPAFLERALAFERAADELSAIGPAESLIDTAILPAMRAWHDDDPGFAVIPPTRALVETVLDLLAREAPERLAAGLDPARRVLTLELLADVRDPREVAQLQGELQARATALLGRGETLQLAAADFEAAQGSESLARRAPFAAAAVVLCVFAIAALALRSSVLGAVAALPTALSLWLVLGAMGQLGLALDLSSLALCGWIAAAGAGPAFVYLSRVRELGRAGAEVHVAVSIALRDVGRPIAEGALASLSLLALLGSSAPPIRAFGALACAGNLTSILAVLVLLPMAARTVRPELLIARNAASREQTFSCVEPARERGLE
jgi:hypothetical protein